jgi:hypothetical protein
MKADNYAEIKFNRGLSFKNHFGQIALSSLSSKDTYIKSELEPGYLNDILNFKYDPDGTLVSREPARRVGNLPLPTNGGTKYFNCLTEGESYAVNLTGIGDTEMTLAVYENTATLEDFYAIGQDVTSVPWTKTKTGTRSICAAYYNESWWVFDLTANTGHSRNTTTSTTTNRTYTGMFGGTSESLEQALVWKDRIWGFFGANIKYSKATDPSIWATPDGGGFQLSTKSRVKSMVVLGDTMYILDAAGGIWTFNYSSDPGTDGFLRQITESGDLRLGVGQTEFPSRLAVSGGYVYVTDHLNVYRLVNNRLQPIGDQLFLHQANKPLYNTCWDIGYGLLVNVFYAVGESYWFVYHHSQDAWTRYEFRWSTVVSETKSVWAEAVVQAGTTSIIFPSPWSGVNFVNPVMLYTQGSSTNLDTLYAPTGGQRDEVYKVRLDTGPIYLGDKYRYKKFKYFVFDMYNALADDDGTTNWHEAYICTVEYVPVGMADKVITNLTRAGTFYVESAAQYRINIRQRARAVQLVFVTDSVVEVFGIRPAVINIDTLRLYYQPVGQVLNMAPSEARTRHTAI